jgi:hypothetical protein
MRIDLGLPLWMMLGFPLVEWRRRRLFACRHRVTAREVAGNRAEG